MKMSKNQNRISEADLTIPALRVVRDTPKGQITTTNLIAGLRKIMTLSPGDEELLEGRNDDHFSQIVRNIKSHKGTPGNLLAEGYLENVGDGFKITDAGRRYLESKGL